MPDDPFRLTSPPPQRVRAKFKSDPARQNVLFAGLSCLAGQTDLFLTDGRETDNGDLGDVDLRVRAAAVRQGRDRCDTLVESTVLATGGGVLLEVPGLGLVDAAQARPAHLVRPDGFCRNCGVVLMTARFYCRECESSLSHDLADYERIST